MKCPTALVNDFTPAQFEEMACTFKLYDADGSGSIDLAGANAAAPLDVITRTFWRRYFC